MAVSRSRRAAAHHRVEFWLPTPLIAYADHVAKSSGRKVSHLYSEWLAEAMSQQPGFEQTMADMDKPMGTSV